ncbi:MAG TPA: type II toxin-antitoxin system RatA family toxin [Limnobacter sp.]|nr:type II toxin-antitoxin system RatA family toxin [Limnobacter sp.]
MAIIEKSVLVHFSAQQMFDLVRNVPNYPQFLPWCGAGAIDPIDSSLDKATVEIAFKGFRQSFCTMNRIESGQAIHMTLVDGPFDHLQGHWMFQALTEDACKVSFVLNYEFSSKVLEQLVGPVFQSVANTVVDSFIRRAEALYSPGGISA